MRFQGVLLDQVQEREMVNAGNGQRQKPGLRHRGEDFMYQMVRG